MKTTRGKFIVLYGINNLGKTTQAKMLVNRLGLSGYHAEYIKYPIYSLKPSGSLLNNYLREGNTYNMTAREAQIIYAKNRTQFEKELAKKLEAGIHIVAEDYTGTGLAWGIGAGVDEYFLKEINSHLLKEDLAFLFDGERFKEAAEAGHKHESDDALANKVRWAHLKLAQEYDWKKINANYPINDIHEILWNEAIGLIEGCPDIRIFSPNFLKPESEKINSAEKLVMKIERLAPTAKLPSRAYKDDAGLDLFANDFYSIVPGRNALIKTGIKTSIPRGCVGLIWDKSGIAISGIHSLAGVIDSGFRGEITVNLINFSDGIYNIVPGQKIAQMLIQKIEMPEIKEEIINDTTERDLNAYGSSGKF